MKDIVDWLRRNADDCERMERWAVPELAPGMREAANEIERLRRNCGEDNGRGKS